MLSKILFNDSQFSDLLEDYFYSVVPESIWKTYNFEKEKVYLNLQLNFLSERDLSLTDTYWYEKHLSNLKPIIVHEDDNLIIYDVLVRIKRNTRDLTGIVKKHPKDGIIKKYVKHIEDRLNKKIIYGLFTYCNSGMHMPIHKDTSELQNKRIHHVIDNGGISSLIFYDDNMAELQRVNGVRGDVFNFDAGSTYHNFERPKNKRLHFILSSK